MGRPSEEIELEQLRPRTRMGRAVRGLAVDIRPLRESRDYRLLFGGQFVSEIGHQITHVAIFIQVYRITHSAFAVGLVGLVALVPLMISTIGFAWIADAFDRRRVLAVVQVGLAAGSGVLLLGALMMPHTPLGLIYGAVAITAFLGGIDSPTRTATVARVVGQDRLASAVALNQVLWNATMVAGPAVGGILVAKLGFSWAYGVDAVTYGATFLTAMAMRPIPPKPGEVPATRGARAVREGFAYLKGRRVIQTTFTVDLVAMIFGMPRALFPVLAVTQFHRGAEVVGYLLSAVGAGALLGALASGWVVRVRHQGLAVVWAVAVWGAAIAAFGLVGSHLWLAMVLLAVAGAGDVISAVFRGTILQLAVPDSLRGRLNGIHILVVTGGPRIGDFEAGAVAALTTPLISVVSGGVACVAGVAILSLLVPEFARYHAGDPG
ncbi:MAG: MFS transporter [Actinomycetota bacterium]